MGKAWKRLLNKRRVEAAKEALEIKEEKVTPAPAPAPAPVVEKKVEEKPKPKPKPKPKRSYKAKKNSTANKKVKK